MTLRMVLGDQVTRGISGLRDLTAGDVVLMVEVGDEAGYVPHHKQKIALIFAAMRHFAQTLRAEGITVDYVRLDDPANTQSLSGEVARAVALHSAARLVVTEAAEYRVLQMQEGWQAALGVAVDIREDARFFCSRDEFARLKAARKTSRMEFFYREMRKRHGILMAGDAPEGGQWNFDPENRKALPKGLRGPARVRFAPDAITREVLDLVARRFGNNFGDLEPFGWAVTRVQALEALDDFIQNALPQFGDYQDAMKAGEDFLFHGLISPYLNCGLLEPREVCAAAEAAYLGGHAPINAVEGFIRQILGWREYVRGIYWTEMPSYAESNHLGAARDLPQFYWTGQTKMRCMAECIGTTRRMAYAHHIQRLMVTGNFALLAGVEPAQIEAWYLAVYADAYDWVELPNVHGMVCHADGGIMGSKPYAASGAYINRMSDYCGGCSYDVKAKLGKEACPFNYLYWNFLIENEDKLGRNARMALAYRNLDRLERGPIVAQAQAFLDAQEPWQPDQPRLGEGW
ncbi:MAG: cryptochrome/photolyase family protein [Cypionkella sp.]